MNNSSIGRVGDYGYDPAGRGYSMEMTAAYR
jgi:hypothetical protein